MKKKDKERSPWLMLAMSSGWHTLRGRDQHDEGQGNNSGIHGGTFLGGEIQDSIGAQMEQQLSIGELVERSISAPPPTGSFSVGGDDEEHNNSSMSNVLLGLRTGDRGIISNQARTTDDVLGGSGSFLSSSLGRKGSRLGGLSASANFFDGHSRDDGFAQQSSVAESIFSDLAKDSDLSPSTSSPSLKHSDYDHRSWNLLGNAIDRPHSAAPDVPSYRSVRAPPGMETLNPPNTSSAGPPGKRASILLDPIDNRIMDIGMSRPASTGVIGDQSNSSQVIESLVRIPSSSTPPASNRAVGGPARLIQMRQIQENSTKPPPTEINLNGASQHTHLAGTAPDRDPYIQGDLNPPAPRVETRYQQRQYRADYQQEDPSSRLYDSAQNTPSQSIPVPIPGDTTSPSPQYVSIPVTQVNHGASNTTVYSQAPDGRPLAIQTIPGVSHPVAQPPPQVVHPQGTYEAPTIYYSSQQGAASRIAGQIPGQVLQTTPVYVNSPFGYALQYHPSAGPQPSHPAPRYVLHPHHAAPPGPHGVPPELISVVPIHPTVGASAQVAGLTSADGTPFAYWQQPGDLGSSGPGGHATAVVVNAQPPPATIAVAGLGAPQLGTTPPGGKHGRGKAGTPGKNSSDKIPGKNRRNREVGGRRAGNGPADLSKTLGGERGVSSNLLEEFRASKNRVSTIEDIKGQIVEFCQDQNGSRFIQQRLETGEAYEKELVITEVLPAVRRLRNDVFGNYVVQKLLEHGTPKMKISLKDTLEGEMLSMSMQMYGCRVVQKALETLDDDVLPGLLTEFHGNVLTCIHDQNGNHVMQKCVEVMSVKAKEALESGEDQKSEFDSEQIQFIIDDVLQTVAPLSCHPYGCRVLQRILEHCVDEQKVRALDEISTCHRALLDDQYGNYVIQHVLQFGRFSDRESILEIIISTGLLSLSRQKFASNVVEKLLKYGTSDQRNAIVREMLKDGGGEDSGGSSVVLLMVRDAYANYVVQTTLDVVSEGKERQMLLAELNANSSQLRNYTFAKHIVTKLGS